MKAPHRLFSKHKTYKTTTSVQSCQFQDLVKLYQRFAHLPNPKTSEINHVQASSLAPTVESSITTHDLQPNSEWRFEVSLNQSIELRVRLYHTLIYPVQDLEAKREIIHRSSPEQQSFSAPNSPSTMPTPSAQQPKPQSTPGTVHG